MRIDKFGMDTIEQIIKENEINLHDYNKEFTDKKVIGRGGYGTVEKAQWARRGVVALKSLLEGTRLNENIVQEFVSEVSNFETA